MTEYIEPIATLLGGLLGGWLISIVNIRNKYKEGKAEADIKVSDHVREFLIKPLEERCQRLESQYSELRTEYDKVCKAYEDYRFYRKVVKVAISRANECPSRSNCPFMCVLQDLQANSAD